MKTTRTLLLLVVGLALVAVGPGCSKSDDDAKDKARRKERRRNKVETAATLVNDVSEKTVTYAATYNELPRSLDVMVRRKLIKPKQLVDPWGARLAYDPGNSGEPDDFSLCSNGPDGQVGTEDDICNHDED